jgi:hypothetical protein
VSAGRNGIRNGNRGPARTRPLKVEVEAPGGALGLVGLVFFTAASWLAAGMVVVATLALNSGWLAPLLVGLALLLGALVGLFPTLIYREEAKRAEAALQELVLDVMEDTRVEIERDPRP